MSSDSIDPIPDQAELLLEIVQLQQESSQTFFQAETAKANRDLDTASAEYQRFVDVTKKLLAASELHQRHFEGPMQPRLTAQTLLSGMFMYADVLQSRADLAAAEALRVEGLEIAGRYADVLDVQEIERQRAVTLILQARFNEALTALTRIRDDHASRGNLLPMARAALDVAQLRQWLGDHERAVGDLKQVEELIAPRLGGGEAPGFEDVATSLATALEAISATNVESAETAKMVQESEDLATLAGIAMEVENTLAVSEKALANYVPARRRFLALLSNYRRAGFYPEAAEIHLASLDLLEGHHEKALTELHRLEPAFRQGGLLRPKLAALLRLQAEALLGQARPAEALAVLDEALVDVARFAEVDLQWRIEWRRAQALRDLDRHSEALAAYGDAARTIGHLRKAPLGYRLDSTFLSDKIEIFNEAIALSGRLGLGRDCAELMEAIKSRTLATVMSRPPVEPGNPGQSEQESELDGLSRRLDALEYQGYRGGALDPAAMAEERSRLLRRRANLLEDLRIADPRWRTVTAPVPFVLQDVIDSLEQHGQAALQLYLDVDEIHAVLIYDGQVDVQSQPLAGATRKALEGYADNLQQVEPDFWRFDLSRRWGVTAEDLVPESLLRIALEAEALIVVPHGLLHLVPWAGLTSGDRRLFERCPIAVVPNLTVIPALDFKPAKTPGIDLVGPPDYSSLPEVPPLDTADDEIRDLERLYAEPECGGAASLPGGAATQGAFWRLVTGGGGDGGGEGRILHLACHGTFESSEPLNSGLLLSDAKVDAAEISRVRITQSEVVLSACSTGWRPTRVGTVRLTGDDILGLPGAFLESGARSVLVSIPKAHDQTCTAFMRCYHRHRCRGSAPLDALRGSQIEMLGTQFPPALWVGFTLYGRR